MFVISTRNFPPEIGGMQNLMGGLANALINHGPVKVFADKTENHESFDKYLKADIERFGGIKLLRKYRKANRIKEYINENDNIRSIFFDHWKSVEKINNEIIKNFPTFCLIHSKEINHTRGSSLNKRVLDSLVKVKYVIANSSFTKKLAISVGVDESKIHIIHPGCDEPIKIDKNFQQQAENIYGDTFPRILTVARLDKRKNHQNILMCIRNLKEKFPKIKYVSVGDGEEKRNLIINIVPDAEMKYEDDIYENSSSNESKTKETTKKETDNKTTNKTKRPYNKNKFKKFNSKSIDKKEDINQSANVDGIDKNIKNKKEENNIKINNQEDKEKKKSSSKTSTSNNTKQRKTSTKEKKSNTAKKEKNSVSNIEKKTSKPEKPKKKGPAKKGWWNKSTD